MAKQSPHKKQDEYPLSPVKFSRLTRRGLILGLSLSQVITVAIAGAVFIASLYAGGGNNDRQHFPEIPPTPARSDTLVKLRP